MYLRTLLAIRLLFALAFVAFISAAAPSAQGASASTAIRATSAAASASYAYDAHAPLNVVVHKTGSLEGVRVIQLSFSGKDAHPVSAILLEPEKASSPLPCLMFLHAFGHVKADMAPWAHAVAGSDYAVILIDEFGFEPGDTNVGKLGNAAQVLSLLKTNVVTAIIDMRRGIDMLQQRPEVDAAHIGVAGRSLGAVLGALLAGVEPRVKAVAVLSGGGNLGDILIHQAQSGDDVGGALARVLNGMDAVAVEARLAPIDPITYAARIAPRALLIIHGRNDAVIPPVDAQELYAAAGHPKQIIWYPDAGHDLLTADVVKQIRTFFDGNLRSRQAAR